MINMGTWELLLGSFLTNSENRECVFVPLAGKFEKAGVTFGFVSHKFRKPRAIVSSRY